MIPEDITYFKTPGHFRKWLEKNHAVASVLWVGFHKKDSGKPSITWPESVDEALCFGWIDGVRKSVDQTSYIIRFSPRKSLSIWSAVNIKRAQELIDLGRMQPAGLDAFQKRKEDRSRRYSYEQQGSKLALEHEKKLRANRVAWKFFSAQPPWYQRTTAWWVTSAKKEETRLKRLEQLIACSAKEQLVPPLARAKK
jgi:uncharacterized protein YdeI (YjbR/CyaY-like superfamily)